MAIKFDKITPGMELLDIHRQRAGNTTGSVLGLWHVRVISVDAKTRSAQVSWNHNPAQHWPERKLKRLYVKPTKAYRDQQERRKNR